MQRAIMRVLFERGRAPVRTRRSEALRHDGEQPQADDERHDGEQAQADDDNEPEAELIVATEDELAAGACCRFCFEAGDGQRLVAPCACTGTQRWVHVACLRKWQTACLRSDRLEPHDRVCQICLRPFALRPPRLPPSPVRAGMLLVASPELRGTFLRAVVLLCQVGAVGRTT